MKRVALLLVILAAAGCKKKPSAPPIPPSTPDNKTSSRSTAPSDKPDFLSKTIQPRAKVASGNRPVEGSFDRLYVSHDGKRLFLYLDNAKVTQVWDLSAEPKNLRTIKGQVYAVSPGGTRLIRYGEGRPEIVDADTDRITATLRYEGEYPVFKVSFMDETTLLGARLKGRSNPGEPQLHVVERFDAATGAATTVFETGLPSDGSGQFLMAGKHIFTLEPKANKVRAWDIAAGKIDREITIDDGVKDSSWLGIKVSEDGGRLMLANLGKRLVFDARTGQRVASQEIGLGTGEHFAGDRLAAQKYFIDSKSKPHPGQAVYSLPDLELVCFLPSNDVRIAYSANGKVAVAYSKSCELIVWDLP